MSAQALAMPLRDEPNVLELFNVLKDKKLEVPFAEFNGLLNTVDTLDNQMKSVLGELQGIHKTLMEAQKQRHPVSSAFTTMYQAVKTRAVTLRQQIGTLKQAIVEGAKRALAAFKEKGISALNGIMRFFKIKPILTAIRGNLEGSIKTSENSIAKIDAMATEYHATGAHLRNIGRIFGGKEAIAQRENGKLAAALQAPYKAMRKIDMAARKGVASLIAKLNRLEQAADKIKEARKEAKKPSLEDQIAAGRAKMEAQTPRPVEPGMKKQEVTI